MRQHPPVPGPISTVAETPRIVVAMDQIPPEFSLSLRRNAKGTEVRAAARGAPAMVLALATIVIAVAVAVAWMVRIAW
jgi:hypothetical protein